MCVCSYLGRNLYLLQLWISRKPCSGYKMKEMTGSGIFKGKGENGLSETDDADQTPVNKTGLRMYQVFLSLIKDISCVILSM